MKKSVLICFPVLTAALILSSCLSYDLEDTGFADALIIVKTNETQTLYGLSLHTFSTKSISSVSAFPRSQPDITYNLTPYQNLKTDYVYETPAGSFSSVLPVTGDYIFKVNYSNGDTLTFINKLNSDIVMPPVIKKCSFNTSLQGVEIEWNTVENDDFYNVKMMDEQGKVIFVSPVFYPITTSYTLREDTQGWQLSSRPAEEAQVTVEVSSFRMESGGGNNHFQATGRSTQTITWGP